MVQIPTVKHYFSDQEYKILLDILKREREQYKYPLSIRVLDDIEKKIRYIQCGSR